MNKNQSKHVGIVFIILILAGLAYFGWFLLKNDVTLSNNANTSTSTKKSASTTTTSPSKSDDIPAKTTPSANLPSFSKEGFNFTFQYPKDWTISSSTDNPLDGNPDIKQKTVSVKTDTGIEFTFNNPPITVSSAGYDLKNTKDITTGTLTFNRKYGNNSKNQTLYTATYNDPNNLDAASVNFEGVGTIDTTMISDLDNIVSSFKFTQ